MAKVIAVLHPDPVDGYPKKYARDDIPKITKIPRRTDGPQRRARLTSSQGSFSAASLANW